MLPPFTPRAPKVKPEPGPDTPKARPELGPDTPWAMRVVVKNEHLVRVEPEHKPRLKPWTPPAEPASEPDQPPEPGQSSSHPGQPHRHGPPAWREEAAHGDPKAGMPRRMSSPPPGRRLVAARNYAAIEHGRERYGLIDSGVAGPTRELIVHVRKKFRGPFRVLNDIRPGSVLAVARRGGRQAQLRVRFTTPARYYSPGCPVTTMNIGVDETDWQSLMVSTHGI